MATVRGSLGTFSATVVLCLLLFGAASKSPAAPPPTPLKPKPTVSQPRGAIDWDWLDRSEKAFRILAYLIGGVWVYFNAVQGRIYRPRLDLRVTGDFKQVGSVPLIVASISIKNIGLTKVEIRQYGSGLDVEVYDSNGKEWTLVRTLDVLKNHPWIEPGETLVEATPVFDVEAKSAVYRLRVILSTKRRYFTKLFPPAYSRIQWEVSAPVV